MIIEFSAIPGSGKSYIAQHLEELLKNSLSDSGVKVFTIRDIQSHKKQQTHPLLPGKLFTLYRILTLIKPSTFQQLLHLLFLTKDFRTNILYMKFFVRILMNYRMLRDIQKKETNPSVFILDEGILHSSVLFLNKENTVARLNQFLERIGSLTYLEYKNQAKLHVFVDSDSETNYQRINARKAGWPYTFSRLDEVRKKDELSKRTNYYRTLKTYALEHEVPFVEIDNSRKKENDFPEKLRLILTEVEQALGLN